MVDAAHSKCVVARRVGSSPTFGTVFRALARASTWPELLVQIESCCFCLRGTLLAPKFSALYTDAVVILDTSEKFSMIQ